MGNLLAKKLLKLMDKTSPVCVGQMWSVDHQVANSALEPIDSWSLTLRREHARDSLFALLTTNHIIPFSVYMEASLPPYVSQNCASWGRKVIKSAFIFFLWSLLPAHSNSGSGLSFLACKQVHRHNRREAYPVKVANKIPRAVFKFSISS